MNVTKAGGQSTRIPFKCLHCKKNGYVGSTLRLGPNKPNFCWDCHQSLTKEEKLLPKAMKLAALSSRPAQAKRGAAKTQAAKVNELSAAPRALPHTAHSPVGPVSSAKANELSATPRALPHTAHSPVGPVSSAKANDTASELAAKSDDLPAAPRAPTASEPPCTVASGDRGRLHGIVKAVYYPGTMRVVGTDVRLQWEAARHARLIAQASESQTCRAEKAKRVAALREERTELAKAKVVGANLPASTFASNHDPTWAPIGAHLPASRFAWLGFRNTN